jgi:hypothetical protein
MPKPRPSLTKRQREQTKRDKKVAKAERRQQRKTERESGAPVDEFEYQEVPTD